MLEFRDIKKTYHVGEIETKALDGISVAFRNTEFVAILGTSGSGKTTCLNIIGGLDRYDSGELVINGRKTSDFREKDWDAYRNNSVGFIFQNYNLIMHLGIVANVELGMTLSGVPAGERRRKAIEALEKVGLKDHLHKKPNQLSGGQIQRVAIARALVSDPEILLCDEPTGSLDTVTSTQIMDLIKDVAQGKLIIMVTHNPDIAEAYADRIIRFQDGKIISDSNPYERKIKASGFSLKKTSMNFLTALRLSFNNLKTKKGRMFLTSFASSIGIIGIAIILSLSTGFQSQIDDFQSDAMSEFPIFISQAATQMNPEDIATMQQTMMNRMLGTAEYAESDEVYLYDPAGTRIIHRNIFTMEYIDYINAIDPEICGYVGYARVISMNMLREKDGTVIPVSASSAMQKMNSGAGNSTMLSVASSADINSMGISSYPKQLKEGGQPYIKQKYELLAGKYPVDATDLVLVIDTRNRISIGILKELGFDTENIESIRFEDIIGTEFRIVPNDAYYVKTEYGTYLPGSDYVTMYGNEANITARITGVVRQKQDVSIGVLAPGIAYSDELSQMVIDSAAGSEIVRAQEGSDRNVITMAEMDADAKNSFITYLGGSPIPFMAMVYPDNFEDKDAVMAYLDAYNEGRDTTSQIIYTDLAGRMSAMTKGIMDAITIVLIAFAAISLIVSLIMISIITYTSVLERTREIGILRALGARKKDITRVFDAETCIIGIFSGLLGIGVAWLLTVPVNMVLYALTDLANVARLRAEHAVMLVVLSTVLTVLGGHIPAIMASKKDAVEALRSGE